MVLAKADLGIAERYARLAGPLGDRFFPHIRDEFERTRRAVLEIGGKNGLLERDETLQRSIRLRNPYVDPMSLLQVDLLERWRATGRQDDEIFRALLATVNGIAQGLQNTGLRTGALDGQERQDAAAGTHGGVSASESTPVSGSAQSRNGSVQERFSAERPMTAGSRSLP